MTRLHIRTVGGLAAAVLLLGASTACGSPATRTSSTFTMAIPSAPAMDPMRAAEGISQIVLRFAYDSLVAFDPESPDSDNGAQPYLAESWRISERSVEFTLRRGITCSDGSPFTPSAGAAALNFAADPSKDSDYLRELPAGLEATADDGTGTITVTTPEPDQFLIYKVGGVFMVCPAGLSNPNSLGTRTQGTGLFELAESVPGDHYTLRRRDVFAWGPGGVSARTPGLPETVNFKVVPNETTAASLFLSRQVNALSLLGADRDRIEGAADVRHAIRTPVGLTFFNQAGGRPGAVDVVRRALTTAMDMPALGRVMTGGHGQPPQSLVTIPPDPCRAATVPGVLPAFDPAAAARMLDEAGWTTGTDGVRSKDGKSLTLTFIYNTALGSSVAAAAELLRDNWQKIGVAMRIKGAPPTDLGTVVYETGDWDAGWLPITVGLPSDFVARLSGPTPPAGANLASINNPVYVEESAAAAALPAAQACPHWVAAERALLADLDVVPIVDGTVPTFGKDIDFRLQGGLIDPTSIRMKGA